MDGIDFASPTLKMFYVCACLLSLKTLMMPILTARLRFKKKIFISPEDKALFKKAQVSQNDPEIERVRRAHRNDLENIPVFITSGFLYTITNPNPILAILLFMVYTIARIGHTYVYAIRVVPQPARFICFGIGYLINMYMAGCVVYHIGIV